MATSASDTKPAQFLILLGLILGLLLFEPLLKPFAAVSMLFDLFFTAIFLSALFSVSHNKIFLVVGGVVALPALVGLWAPYIGVGTRMLAIGKIAGVVFFAMAIYAILRFVMTQKEVNREVIFASLVVYLLMAVMWSYLYLLTESLAPGSFEALEDVAPADRHMALIYYSFVTITTLGYGDITPSSEIARSVTILEAIIGQLYMVVLVAWLVGMHVSRRSRG